MEGGTAYALLHVDGSLSNVPSCAEGNAHKLSIKLDGDIASMKYSTALAAVLAKTSVWVSWSNTDCGLWGSSLLAGRFDLKSP